MKTLGQVAEYWLADPQRTLEMQTRLGKSWLDLWASAARRLAGEPTEPVAAPDPRDKRFSDPEWSSNQYFDFLKQAYLVTADWAKHLVDDANQLDPGVRQKADFYMRQLVNAASPSNFIFTNPELLRTTINENAENLVRGTQMLAEDIAAGGGELRIRQSDASKFEVGRNLAITPGKVIYQNELMQLIQYAPSTEKVLRRPLLIVPPWINKFYVLDLTPEKSFIRWCRDNGDHGVRHLLGQSGRAPRRRRALPSTCARARWRRSTSSARSPARPRSTRSATASAAPCSRSRSPTWRRPATAASRRRRCSPRRSISPMRGDLKVFAATPEQIEAVERQMAERGYLEGAKMATAFNLLRSNDLIWPYVVNNYLKGEAPFPFDLLYWNSDATRMPAANHSYYLRNCYLENNLTKGKMTIDGVGIDLGNVKVPIYNLATREDHIAPAKSVYRRLVRTSAGRCATCSRAPATSPASSTRPPRRSTSTGPARRRTARTSRRGSRPRPSIRARGGPTGSPGSRRRTRPRSRRASPAAARTSRSRMRREATSRCGADHPSFRGAHQREPGIQAFMYAERPGFRVRCCAPPRNDGVGNSETPHRHGYAGLRNALSILRASAFRAALQASADRSVAKMIDSVWTLDRWNWLSATIST